MADYDSEKRFLEGEKVMSWYSDGERYNERPDPPYCKRCKKIEVSKEVCDRCVWMHEEREESDE